MWPDPLCCQQEPAGSHRGPSYCLSIPTPTCLPSTGGSHVTRLPPQVPFGTQGGVQGDPGQSEETAAPPVPSLGLGMTRGLSAVSGPSAWRGPYEPSHPAPLGPCKAGAALRVGPWVRGGGWGVGGAVAPGVLGLNPFHAHLAAGQPPRNPQPGANCYCQSQAPPGSGSQKLLLLPLG